MDTAHYSVYKMAAPPLNKGTQAEHTLPLLWTLLSSHSLGLITTPEGFERPRPGPSSLFVCAGRPLIVRGPVPRNPSICDYGGSGPTSKLEEDPILAKALARTDMGSSEGQTSATSIRHVEIEGRSIAVMIPNEAHVDTEADVDSIEDLSAILNQCSVGDALVTASRGTYLDSRIGHPTLRLPMEKMSCGVFWGKFPGKHALNQIIVLWKVHPTFQFHGSGWIVFRFASTEDQNKVLENGPYMIYGSPLLLKPMTKYFSFGKEAINTFPIWVQLRNVPLTLWNPIIFGMICSRLGRPIRMDRLTTSKERITYARCLAEVDMAKELVYSVMLNLDDKGEHERRVYYENLLRYCPQCKKVGHTKENCKAKQAENRDKGGKTNATDSGKQPTTSDAGEGTRGEWVIKQNTSIMAISASEEPVGCSVEKETAIQELTHNPESTPVNLESMPILAQSLLEPAHPQESYPIPDNQMTEHRLAHPQ
ncbi:hypothetical protein Acr_23g0015080 [Actinidia rufa]|uniref:DUF4283 domain-containing protein n=1 Tax=Actinidia rufa TaxID=165716 RepID=A0A7J0GQR6_9ERIC|nr:hypothetical protein Acr_23g0015080 [Actinidia rufa]